MTKVNITLMQSFGRSKGVQLESMLRNGSGESSKQRGTSDEDSLGRDETELNQQESEPTPISLTLLKGKKQRSTNLVTPFCPDSALDDTAKQVKAKMKNQSRYQYNEADFSRDVTGVEDIGIGDDDCGVLFDD